MQLIKDVRVEGFRSIRNSDLSDFSSLTSFVGKNSSGKSNILRALNLFFNDEVEPGKALVFSRDVYDEVPRLKKKKKISISVTFNVPDVINFRRGFEDVKSLGTSFTVVRKWELDVRQQVSMRTELFVNGLPKENGQDLARRFLSLISFRYIPNRSVPAKLLREEGRAVASAIFRRIRSGGQQGQALIQAINEAAQGLLESSAISLSNTGSPLAKPSVATAESLGEMLQMTGFQAVGSHGGTVQDEDWGAGHQAFFLYNLLRTMDTDVSQSFGWRQAAIWAVEEPESALHRDLETRLADEFRAWATAPKSRLQILQTTHSPILTMASESGYWVEIDDKRSKFSPMKIPELTRAAELRGVSGWVHPVLSYPWNGVVLVEGEIDAQVFSHVAKLANIDTLRFMPLPTLDPDEKGGGKDLIIKYLRSHSKLIPNRPKTAPFIVLFDWDVSETQLASARKIYGENADRFVLKMNEELCPFELGRTFKGIERFYPPRIILEAHEDDEIIVGQKAGRPYSVAPEELSRAKRKLLDRFLRVKKSEDIRPLLETLVELDNLVRGESEAQLRLPGI